MDFKTTVVATNLDVSVPHTIQMKLQKKANTAKQTNNDVFTVKVDNKTAKNTTFEAYYTATGEDNYKTDTLLFRASGTALPSTSGQGFVIDDLTMQTS